MYEKSFFVLFFLPYGMYNLTIFSANRNKHFQDVSDEKSLQCIQDVVSLLEKIKNKEVY